MVDYAYPGKVRWPLLPTLLILSGAIACGSSGADVSAYPTEEWTEQPISEWPDFVLTNDVSFQDTTFKGLANAFTVDTGLDTVGVTCKHIFMVFETRLGLHTIALGEGFRGWTLRSSRDSTRALGVSQLINEDPSEPVGDLAGIKDRDWILFELDGWSEGIHPLKIRYAPLESGEVVHAIVRTLEGRDDHDPEIRSLRTYRAAGTYYYVEPLDPDADPTATSGSPVIDRNGYLVGLVSGGVGRLGVVAGVAYLRDVFDRFGIEYRVSE
jgi:hypothetical protein